MRLEDCELNIAAVVSAPLLRTKPDDSWLSVYKNKSIPESLYKFYTTAEYFSFDKCPKFLRDGKNILFAHLETSVELIKSSFEEYSELVEFMKKYDKDSFNPIKKAKGETFDPSAPKYFKRYFQLLIINMYSILDSTAEAVAIILSWGKLGRGEFARLIDDTINVSEKNKDISAGIIMKIEDKYIEDMKLIIKEEVIEENNNEWFELFKTYRNKLSHFRQHSTFLLHDKKGDFYHFLPRQWPYYFQQDMKYGRSNEEDMNSLFSELLMDQDIFEYCDGLYKKIYRITERMLNILTEVFKIKKESGYEINSDIQEKLTVLTQKYKFKHF